ncbi:MAG: HutD family protein [Myxococcota bacterium]|nr:HutD family protein [Myxococcota bacterium]
MEPVPRVHVIVDGRRSAVELREPVAWGGGLTYELARWPPGSARFAVRASLAGIERDGPFSRFPGHRRWSVLAGAGAIELRTAARCYRLAQRGAIVELDGDEPIEAVLGDGPAQLFNVLATVPVRVGVGPSPGPVRLAFALDDAPELGLSRGHAMIDAPAVTSRGIVWIE